MPAEWDVNSVTKFQIPREEHSDEAHQGPIYAFQVRGRHLVTASADRTICKWDIQTGRLTQPPLVSHEGSVICLQFDDAPDQDVIISGSVDSSILLWKFSTGDVVKRLSEGHVESVLSLHFDDKYLVSGGKDKGIKLWNRHRVRELTALPEFVRSSHPAVESPDGLEEYTLLASLAPHQAAVNAVQIHRDTIISGSGDRKIHVWNLQSGQITQSLAPHQRGIADLLFNGRLLLAGASDNIATIYDVGSQQEKARLTGHKSLIRAVHAISDDWCEFVRIVTGSYDGTVRIWEKNETDPEQWVVKSTLEYGIQPELISNDNPYIHHYEEGQRVFEACIQDNQVFCSGQGNTVVGWEFAPTNRS